MTTAVIGTGTLGSVIARLLASGGESLRLSSAHSESARTLAAEIGPAAIVAGDNRDALRGADAVVLALRFTALKGVIDEIADRLTDKLVVVPSNPLALDAQGKVVSLLQKGQSSGEVVTEWLPAGARLAMAFGTLSADLFESSSNRSPELAILFYMTDDERAGEEVARLIRTAGFEPVKAGGVEQSGRLEVGGDLHDLVVGPKEVRSMGLQSNSAELRHVPLPQDMTTERPLAIDPLEKRAAFARARVGSNSGSSPRSSGRREPTVPSPR